MRSAEILAILAALTYEVKTPDYEDVQRRFFVENTTKLLAETLNQVSKLQPGTKVYNRKLRRLNELRLELE